MEIEFATYGNKKQEQVWRLWNDPTVTDIVYGGSKGSGKSFLGCSIIFADALTYPETFYFIARHTLTDLRKFTLPSIYEVLNIWGVAHLCTFNAQSNFFELHNKSRVYLIEASYRPSDPQYQRFGSMQMTRGWIEEAGEFCEEAKNNLQATIGRWKNDTYKLTPKLLQTCNPAKNYLFADYYQKHRNGTLESWKRFVQALPTDNKRLPNGYLQNLERSLTNNQKQRLLFGNWEFDDNPDLLVTYEAVCDCFTNTANTDGTPTISADLAMKGRDRFVCILWSGDRATIKADTDYSDARQIEQTIKRIADTAGVGRSRIVADSDGLGAYLSAYIDGIKEFHGGATANDSAQFANLKSECAYRLAEKINNRQLQVVCSEEQRGRIADELMLLIAEDSDTDIQKKRLISKDKMKQLLGHSPDYLDALLMGQYFNVKPTAKGIRRASAERRLNYNIYDSVPFRHLEIG